MLLLVIIILVMTIPLASHHLSPILITDLLFIKFQLSCLSPEIYGGLFQITLLSQSIEISQTTLLSQTHEILLSFFVPIMIYPNAETEKSRILLDLKGKAGIYMWAHLGSGKIYIGSAADLSKRLSRYYSLSELKRTDNYICSAIILHTHSAFSLSILEFIDTSNLSNTLDARNLILSREQFYLDLIFEEHKINTYNLLKVAGSSLGYIHSEESLAKMSEVKSGENHPNFGKSPSLEANTKRSIALSGENNPMFGRTGENHPMKKNVFVYSFDLVTKNIVLYKEFNTCIEAAKYFNCSTRNLSRYLDKNKLYKKEWFLYSSEQ